MSKVRMHLGTTGAQISGKWQRRSCGLTIGLVLVFGIHAADNIKAASPDTAQAKVPEIQIGPKIAPADKTSSQPPEVTIISYDLAIQKLSVIKDRTILAKELNALLESLNTEDSLRILGKYIPLLSDAEKAKAYRSAGDIARLTASFQKAAEFYALASVNSANAFSPADTLLSARCAIAAGNLETAKAKADMVAASVDDPLISASAQLVLAWIAAFDSREADAKNYAAQGLKILSNLKVLSNPNVLSNIKDSPGSSYLLKELSFFSVASLKDYYSDNASSFEALSAQSFDTDQSVSLPPLPHWFFSSGRITVSSNTLQPGGSDGPAQQHASSSTTTAKSNSDVKLQVGYFANQTNAQRLVSTLKSQGFNPVMVEQTRNGIAGWIVAVEAGKDMQITLLQLKNLNYESWPIDLP